jgi:hypothetical protein
MVRELNLRFKLAIQQKGGVGLRSLKVIFRRMDFNGNKKLDSSEFEQALAAFGYVDSSSFLSTVTEFSPLRPAPGAADPLSERFKTAGIWRKRWLAAKINHSKEL